MRRSPLIPGHQVVGRLATGERVGLAWLGGADGTCKYCEAGLENLCEAAEFTGWTVNGGYAERVVARSDYVFPLPDGLSDIEAAPLLCGGIIGYRSLRYQRHPARRAARPVRLRLIGAPHNSGRQTLAV